MPCDGRVFSDYRLNAEAAREILGDGHPDVLRMTSTLSDVLGDLREWARATDILRHAMVAGKSALGEEHPAVVFVMAGLATALCKVGDLEAARELAERTLELSRRVRGVEDPLAVGVALGLATICTKSGDHTGTVDVYEQVLPIVQRRYGERHPLTVMVTTGLAAALRLAGQPARAAELESGAIEAAEGMGAGAAPEIDLFRAAHQFRTWSVEQLRAARERSRQSAGEENQVTLELTVMLAMRLLAEREPGRAVEVLAPVLPAMRRILGPTHESTLGTTGLMGTAQFLLGERDAGCHLMEEAYGHCLRVHGEHHLVKWRQSGAIMPLWSRKRPCAFRRR